MRIYKYPIEITDLQILKLPVDSEIISIVNIGEKPYVYAIVEASKESVIQHEIICYGTGHNLKPDFYESKFLGTVVFSGGRLVFHFFHRKL